MQGKVLVLFILNAYAKVHLIPLEAAWTGMYVGKEHEVLLRNINKMTRGKPYSNSVLLNQSSGTGKSRLVDEQGKLVFTLPFNIRPQTDSEGQMINSTAYYIP